MKTSLALFLALASVAHSGPRTSASYSIVTDTADAGGQRATSASYTNDASAGGVVGISTVASPAETVKSGYIGQLTEVTALQLTATPTTVNEGSTRQLSASLLNDDLTTHAVPAASITWSIVSGPLASINSTGLATAATVYQNTAATAQGIYAGNTGTLGLNVLDSIPDNFGTYAGDGIGDDWQFLYFGLNNSNAAPQLDPDFDGHNNLFEYTAGIIPTDPTARFLLNASPVPNQPGQMSLVINPRFNDRTYTVKTSTTLGRDAVWTPLNGSTVSDNGLTRTITDSSATGATKFYMIEITKP